MRTAFAVTLVSRLCSLAAASLSAELEAVRDLVARLRLHDVDASNADLVAKLQGARRLYDVEALTLKNDVNVLGDECRCPYLDDLSCEDQGHTRATFLSGSIQVRLDAQR